MTSISDHRLRDLKHEPNEELLEEVVKLDLHQFGRPWTRKKWAEAVLDENKALFALLDRDGELLGFSLWQLSAPEKLGHLLKIHIEQAQRRKGLGYHLLLKSQERLAELGLLKFYLEVEVDNIAAIRLYETLDYRVLHSRSGYYDDGKDAFFMMSVTETE